MINEQIEIVREDKKNELLMMKTYIEKGGGKKKTEEMALQCLWLSSS